jgi:hypothetical protein
MKDPIAMGMAAMLVVLVLVALVAWVIIEQSPTTN